MKPSSVAIKAASTQTVQPSIQEGYQEIAVIGMAGRFPGAKNLDEFWQNLSEGKSTITGIPKNRWDHSLYYDPDPQKPNKTSCNKGGFLDNIDQFDPAFFNMSGKEAELSDPQQRLFLEESWNALEDAGYANDLVHNSRCGVFAGIELGEYFYKTMAHKEEQEAQSFWGKDSSIATARISYFFNLKGPSLAVNTATSSSLTALHLACQSLRLGESDMALAGGVFLCLTPSLYLWAGKAGMLSATGKCKAFDENADGFVPGEGVGVILLKPLVAALRDRNHIYGVIKGSAINQDGKTNGLVAPNALSQAELYSTVYEKSNIDPDSIQYVEAHGTGTQLGDPAEIEGLNHAFQKYTQRKQFCAIGSVKTNIGHGLKAAGIASIIKVLLALKHKQIPPSLNFTTPNPKARFNESPFYVNTQLETWTALKGQPRRAAVSSVGMGGTNVHVVIEEAPSLERNAEDVKAHHLIVLSAKTTTVLYRQVKNLQEWLEKNKKATSKDPCFWDDLSYALLVGKRHFDYRLAIVFQGYTDLQQQLTEIQKVWKKQGRFETLMYTLGETVNIRAKQEIYEKLQNRQNLSQQSYRKCLEGLGVLYENAHNPDWKPLFKGTSVKHLPLPTYPFERERFWITLHNKPAYFLKMKGSSSDIVETLNSNPDEVKMKHTFDGEKQIESTNNSITTIQETIEFFLIQVFSEELKLSLSSIQSKKYLDEYGIDSIHRENLVKTLEQHVGKLPPTLLFEYQSITELAEYFAKNYPQVFSQAEFPLSSTFETPLLNGPSLKEAIPRNTLPIKEPFQSTIALPFKKRRPVKVKKKHIKNGIAIVGVSGHFEGVHSVEQLWEHLKTSDSHNKLGLMDPFDPKLFRISTENAEMLQEYQKRLLQSVWTTLEDANFAWQKDSSHIGVFIGEESDPYQIDLARLISHCFDLSGPTFSTNTSIDAVLEAIHKACKCLYKGKCKGALVGGTSRKGGGCLFLKPLSQAISDGNRVYGVIKASHLQSLGKNKNFLGGDQQYFYTRLLEKAHTSLQSVDYIELLDLNFSSLRSFANISFQDLQWAYSEFQNLSIGSVLSDMGSLETASGIAGVIKVLLQMKHRTLLPSVKLVAEPGRQKPSFFPQSEQFWEASSARRACVHALGKENQVGLVLEEYLENEQNLIVLSANTPTALREQVLNLKYHLEQRESSFQSLQNITYTLQVCRKELKYRLALMVQDKDDLVRKLTLYLQNDPLPYGVFSGEVQPLFSELEEDEDLVEFCLLHGKIDFLGRFWVVGHSIDWEKLHRSHSDSTRRRIPLPTYPFAFQPQQIVLNPQQNENVPQKASLVKTDIAIIGVGGRYPMATNLDEFWENLKKGKDCIITIPEERWNYQLYYDEQKVVGKTNSKWGGFLEDVDKFDPLFFNISPREAALMDPQERLFLEVAWETMEDAGYTREALGENVGVFVGAMYGDYRLLGTEVSQVNRIPGAWLSSIANRVSYCFDLHGPSMVIDSMCSASLTAVHFACDSIRYGDCDIAFAGGVNCSLHPFKYTHLSQGGFTSSDGRCRSFGDGGDGYVPGEGVGAILLKPLNRAIIDQDQIYAVIKGSSINHGGRTNGYTVPNPKNQGQLIEACIRKSGVDPGMVSYLEAHGTGTSLGDPIEIEGLTRAYRKFTDKAQYCAIGSVKSNIGHLESAAGIAGITKVLLQMKHKLLLPSLHSQILNPKIQFEKTPFYVQQSLAEWKVSPGTPRLAGVSSFGAGGANAHVMLEAFEAGHSAADRLGSNSQLIVLSAKNKTQLQNYVERFQYFLTRASSLLLQDIAYTLQIGREAMSSRLAICAFSINDFIQKLSKITRLSDRVPIEGVYWGDFTESKSQELFDATPLAQIRQAFLDDQFNFLAKKWVQGTDIDWKGLYQSKRTRLTARRISLPSYPFAKERYWIGQSKKQEFPKEDETSTTLSMETLYLHYRWQESVLSLRESSLVQETLWVFDNSNNETTASLLNHKLGTNNRIIRVKNGSSFQQMDANTYQIRVSEEQDYNRLIELLFQQYGLPQKVLYLWAKDYLSATDETLHHTLQGGLYSLLFLVQALMEYEPAKTKLVLQRPLSLLYVYPNDALKIAAACSALQNFFHVINCENPKFAFQAMEVLIPAIDQFSLSEEILEVILKEFLWLSESQKKGKRGLIRYQEGRRWERHLLEYTPPSSHSAPFPIKENGIYLVTGGAGGLGLIFAKYFAAQANTQVLLIGRSSLDEVKTREIHELNRKRSAVVYLQCDVSQKDQVHALIEQIKKNYKRLDGIVHAAGLLDNAFLINKSHDDVEKICAPKIYGTTYLDEVTADERLDFFVLFSSVAVEMDSVMRSDYTYANAFLDYYAERRTELQLQGKRYGKTISLNWPLWKEGGMQNHSHEPSMMTDQTGIYSMPSNEGVQAFETALASDKSQIFVLYGKRQQIQSYFLEGPTLQPEEKLLETKLPPVQKAAQGDLFSATAGLLKAILSEIIELSESEINEQEDFAEYGLDSIMILEFSSQLEKKLGSVPKTLLLEYKNVHDLANALVESHYLPLNKLFVNQVVPIEEDSPTPPHSPEKTVSVPKSNSLKKESIAIVGISGRFPGAQNLEDYWNNLKLGKTSIAEVPKMRWDAQAFYDPDASKAATSKIYCKWGAFLDEVDQFDPLFFGITPLEAKNMPPEERLLLETVWCTLYDGGIAPKSLANQKIGVFLGVNNNTYKLQGINNKEESHIVPMDNSFSDFPNRISYFFNFTGPSLAIDTACSSSLVAIHMACESIQSGSCHAAIAGGVNMYFHPSKYLRMCRDKLISTTATAEVFKSNKDGFVPGEAIGTVFLKPLSQAEQDGNTIYGLIKASAINHKGKSNGFFNPSPQSQAALIEETIQKADIDVESIGYVELQATGSEFTDVAEWSALNRAFRGFTKQNQFCAMGSIKPNIGHAEAASGIAQLTKILLQMKHQYLAPTTFSSAARSEFPLKDSPFFFLTEGMEWVPNQNPQGTSENQSAYPRRAGLGAIAAGGTEAYLILEEAPQKPFNRSTQVSNPLPAYSFNKIRCWAYESPVQESRIGEVSLKVGEYYDHLATTFNQGVEEEQAFLIVPPFQKTIENFSWLFAFVDSKQCKSHFELMLTKQEEFKGVFYKNVDFEKVHTVMDIGCGLSTDLINLVQKYPNLQGNGYTVSQEQARIGKQRIQEKGLADRLEVFYRDSSQDPFPQLYDLILGFEVTVHIENKQGAFQNIAEHLNPEGTLILADCITNTTTSIDAPHVGHYTSTSPQYCEVLAKNGFKVIECIDASQEISNFFHDPNFEQNLHKVNTTYPNLKELKHIHWGWDRFGKLLGSRIIQYLVLTVKKADQENEKDLFDINLNQFKNPLSYSSCLEQFPHLEKKISYEPAEIPYHLSEIALLKASPSIQQNRSSQTNQAQSGNQEGQQEIVHLKPLIDRISELASKALEIPAELIDVTARFADYGVDSLISVILLDSINRYFETELQVSVIYDYSSILDLSQYIAGNYAQNLVGKLPEVDLGNDGESMDATELPIATVQSTLGRAVETKPHRTNKDLNSPNEQEIAIIGMSGRFPGAKNIQTFWENLKNGVDSVIEVPMERWDVAQYYDANPKTPNKTSSKWGGFLEDVDKFDPLFFHISPSDAKVMDPQQRLFLEECWHALEDAGYSGVSLDDVKCGVFAGVSINDYLHLQNQEHAKQFGQAWLGNLDSILPARIAYHLNLKGPTLSVDTACSSSLVAMHMAGQVLQNGEADLMLAGGVSLYLSEFHFVAMSQMGMLSPTGKCCPFDAKADGMVVGEAVGVVVLKRLETALKEGDTIYGVIKGSGINQDGRTNGLTAPSMESQKSLELEVWEKSGVHPETISYVETHGTSTPLGDPIEVTALTQAFQHHTHKVGYCALGAVKSNVGHTASAAGVVGVIKILLAMQHRMLPGLLHYQQTNPHIFLETSPFYINTELKGWEGTQRRAAISSFGISGTNCHMVIEEAPHSNKKQKVTTASQKLFLLSARTSARLKAYVHEMLHFLNNAEQSPIFWDNFIYTLHVGRAMMPEKLALVVSHQEELVVKLTQYLESSDLEKLDIKQMHLGGGPKSPDQASLLKGANVTPDRLQQWTEQQNVQELAKLWVKGIQIDWKGFYASMVTGQNGLKRIPLPTYPFVKSRFWLNELVTTSKLSQTSPFQLKHQFLEQMPFTVLELEKYQEAFKRLNQYTAITLLSIFQSMGGFKKSGESYILFDLIKHFSIVPQYFRLFDALLQILADAGFLEIHANKIVTKNLDDPDLQIKLGTLKTDKHELFENFPEVRPHITLLSLCLEAYPDLLQGKTEAVSVVFPQGSSTLVEGTYYGNSLLDYFHKLVAFLIKNSIEEKLQQDPDCQIRIVEVGAGTGGTSRFVLKEIQPYAPNIHYFFTDISTGFTLKAKKKFGKEYPFVTFQAFDIEKEWSLQKLPPEFMDHQIDIVFGSNVFHATKNLNHTLNQVQHLLKADGLFFLNEITKREDYITAIFGLLEGWWLFDDPEVRTSHSPLLSVENWLSLLEKSGFRDAEALGIPGVPVDQMEQGIIFARNGKLGDKRPKSSVKVSKQESIRTTVSFQKELNPIKQIFAKILEIEIQELHDSVDLKEYGVDSLNSLEIYQAINEHFQIDLNLDDIREIATLGEMAKLVFLKQRGIVQEGQKPNKSGVGRGALTPEQRRLLLENYDYVAGRCAASVQSTIKQDLLIGFQTVKTEVFVYGEGPSLVLLPPINATAMAWTHQIAYFSKQFKVISLHYPGCGQSEFDRDYSHLEAITDNLFEILGQIIPEQPFHLVGWSLGGFISQLMTLKYPKSVLTHTLVNTVSKLNENNTIETVQRLYQDLIQDFESTVPPEARTQREGRMDFIRAIFNSQITFHYIHQVLLFDVEKQISQIERPTLIISGRRDRVTPATPYGDLIHRQIKNSNYHVLEDGGHYIPLQKPTYFNRLLMEFLKNNLGSSISG